MILIKIKFLVFIIIGLLSHSFASEVYSERELKIYKDRNKNISNEKFIFKFYRSLNDGKKKFIYLALKDDENLLNIVYHASFKIEDYIKNLEFDSIKCKSNKCQIKLRDYSNVSIENTNFGGLDPSKVLEESKKEEWFFINIEIEKDRNTKVKYIKSIF